MNQEETIKIYLQKAQAWCAYQERHQQELRDKLYSWKTPVLFIEPIISQLIADNFLNEERYAVSYAGGKFRIKKWGRLRIKLELKRKGISDYSIQKGLKETAGKIYDDTIRKLISEKSRSIKESNDLKRKHKLAQYVIGKGYEPELVWEILNEK
jgi:regulatory protein